ncbi:MAG: hypothetical protein PHO64_01625 [Thiomonas sp.]|nr:hypothetical protein [Thiomonas sp.]
MRGVSPSSKDDTPILSDTKVRALKPKDKVYRIYDERGLYVQVSTSSTLL